MALGKIVNKVFGSGKAKFKPTAFDAGGLQGRAGKISSTDERLGLVQSISEQFTEQAGLTRGLRESVTPGFSALRDARLGRVEANRSRSISNLSENLSRRRVLGSSFAQDALSRADAEFAQQQDEIESETFLQELSLSNNLINQEFEQSRAAFETSLNNLNFEAGIASGAVNTVNQQLGALSQLEQKQSFSAAAGLGSFLGGFIPKPPGNSGTGGLF